MRRAWIGAALAASVACGGGGQPGTPSAPTPGSNPTVGIMVANEGWLHVAEGSPVVYRSNPPASGSHYPVWLRYELFTAPVARGYWVHNLEHGAIVLLHRPDAPAAGIDQLRAVYRALPIDPACGHPRAVLTPDPDLDVPFAAVAADRVLELDRVEEGLIRSFVAQHRGHAPEDVCAGGSRP